MCGPVLGILGAVVSGVGSAMSAMRASLQAKAQAQLADRQARIERQAGAYQAGQAARKADRVMGAARAAGAASGVDISSGSEADVALDSALEAQRDIDAIRWNASAKADTYDYEKQIHLMNAKNNAAAAPFAFLTPVLSGVARFKSQFA